MFKIGNIQNSLLCWMFLCRPYIRLIGSVLQCAFLAASVACALGPIAFDVFVQRRRGARVVAAPQIYLRVIRLRPLNSAAVSLPTTNDPSANELLPNKGNGTTTAAISNDSSMQNNVRGSEFIIQTIKSKKKDTQEKTRKASLPKLNVTRMYSFNIHKRKTSY